MGIFSRKKRLICGDYIFTPKEQVESTLELSNPGCGQYSMYTLEAQHRPDLEELGWCMNQPLVLVFFQIGSYRKKPFDEAALRNMGQVLEALRTAGKDVILRVAYDNEGRGLEREPETFEQVLSHMEQMRDLLGEYSREIYLFQGLFLGSWGEMHTSRYLGTDRIMLLSEKLRDILGPMPYMAFRRPMQYRRLYKKVDKRARTGLFDDGILGSDNDLGTFGQEAQEEAGWENPWRKEDEYSFLRALAECAPIGGEAVLGEHKSYPYSLDETLLLLRKLHVSYLNSAYDTRVYRAWEQLEYERKGPWKGMNGRDYIFRHMGYRFRVVKVEARPSGERLQLAVTIKNDGFARAYRKILPCVHVSGSRWEGRRDISALAPGKELVVEAEIAPGEGEIFFGAENDRGEKIAFANEGCEGTEVILGTMSRR